MSFQTVLSIVGMTFTAIELYQRFRQKDSSGSVQSPISPRAEPNNRGRETGAKLREERNETQSGAERRLAERSPKFGMV